MFFDYKKNRLKPKRSFSLLLFTLQDDEQPFETDPEDSNVNMKKSELSSTGSSDSGSDQQEDLLEGDLGLGTGAANVVQE